MQAILIQQLRQAIQTATPILESTSPAEMASKAQADKWSHQEIVGHLIDSAYNNHQRFLRAVEQDDLIFNGYDQVEWVRLNGYQERTLSELIQLWAKVNLHIAELLGRIPYEIFTRQTSQHNFDKICMNLLEKGCSTNLAYLVWDYIFHLEHHLAQILPSYNRTLAPFHSYHSAQ